MVGKQKNVLSPHAKTKLAFGHQPRQRALYTRLRYQYCCTVFRRTDVPIGRCTAFWSCRCVFTYHMVCTSTSFTVPWWYRPIGEIAPGCLLSAAALPGKAVCSIYQFSIAPIRGCLAKPCIKSLIALWHRCAQKIQYLKTRSHPVPSHA